MNHRRCPECHGPWDHGNYAHTLLCSQCPEPTDVGAEIRKWVAMTESHWSIPGPVLMEMLMQAQGGEYGSWVYRKFFDHPQVSHPDGPDGS